MVELLTNNAYLHLFLLSFLAATVVPVGSEWLLVALLAKSFDPVLLLFSATSGNVLGACTTYGIGIFGGPFLTERVLRISHESREKATGFYQRFGTWSLLLSWLPIIGDPLCLIGGIFRISIFQFVSLVLVGKFARYAFVSMVTLKIVG